MACTRSSPTDRIRRDAWLAGVHLPNRFMRFTRRTITTRPKAIASPTPTSSKMRTTRRGLGKGEAPQREPHQEDDGQSVDHPLH